jgi:predicted nucleic-acid-binding protein
MQDDPVQSEIASRRVDTFSESDPAFISLVSVVESVWVLRSRYHLQDSAIASFIDALLAAPEFVVQAPDVLGCRHRDAGHRRQLRRDPDIRQASS